MNGVQFTTSVSGQTVTSIDGGVSALLNTQATNDNNTRAFGDRTFTATQETLTFNVFGSTNGSNPAASPTGAGQINALQVRSIPEPSSTALLGLGGLALLLRRKK